MGVPIPKRIKLQDAVKYVDDGVYAERIAFQDDEYIVLQSPWSRPAQVMREYWKTFSKVMQQPEGDEEREEFLEEDSVRETVYCIVDWCIYGKNGTPHPVPTEEDTSSWWAIMEDERMFIMRLINHIYYQRPGQERPTPKEGEDPKSEPSGIKYEKNGASLPQSTVSVKTRS